MLTYSFSANIRLQKGHITPIWKISSACKQQILSFYIKTKSWKCYYSRKYSILIYLIIICLNIWFVATSRTYKTSRTMSCSEFWNDWVSVNTKITTWHSMNKKNPTKYQTGVRLNRFLWINPIIYLFQRFYNRNKIRLWKTYVAGLLQLQVHPFHQKK